MIPVLFALLSIRAGLATPVHDVSFARLPIRVVHDMRGLATRTPLTVLGVGALAAALSHTADVRTSGTLGASHAADTALDGGAVGGGGAVQFGIAGGVYAIGLAAHHDGTAATGTALLESQIVEGIVTQGLKHAVSRTRPDGGHYSFPSGHTSSAFATADVLLQRFGWRAGLAAYAGAAYVGASRIAEREHYLSDVVFGAAIGIASARAVTLTAGSRRVDIAAVPVRHGVALRAVIRPPRS